MQFNMGSSSKQNGHASDTGRSGGGTGRPDSGADRSNSGADRPDVQLPGSASGFAGRLLAVLLMIAMLAALLGAGWLLMRHSRWFHRTPAAAKGASAGHGW